MVRGRVQATCLADVALVLDAEVEAVDVLLQVTRGAGLVIAMLTGKSPDLLVHRADVLLQGALAGQQLSAQRATHLGDS